MGKVSGGAAGEPEEWRRTFWTLCGVQFAAMLAFGMATPFLPLYVQALGVVDARDAAKWAGVMSSGGMLVMAAVAPVWGVLADRYGRKQMVTRALFGGGLVVAVMGLVRSPEQLLALRLVQGLFSGTVSATRTLVSSVAPVAQLGYVLGTMQTAGFLGNTAGPLVGGLIADRVGYGPSFIATGVLLIATGLIALPLIRENFRRPVVTEADTRGFSAAVRLVMGLPGLPALVATLFFVQAGMSAVQPVLPLFVGQLADSEEGVATMAGLMLGAGAATGALAAGVSGRVGDRLGHTRVVAACSLLTALLYLPQALVNAPWQLLALRAAQGTFTGGLMPGVMAIIAVRTPVARRGLVFGLTATSTALGSAFGPAAGAVTASVFGLRGAFVVTAVVLGLAGVWVAIALRQPAEGARGSTR